ncbi:Plasmid partitioning protein ParA [Campylobacter fetus subsp. venerealis str. 84-112]|uniref:Uncharacterized protein n=2 Tax=Campylobacter fetus subsp. venerealis TaxID=32020 RepID=A0AAE6MA93_CAMFE|nr:plasmid partitioning protein [Campylobacter fetus subsp. venerealis NCTC 10354]AIR80906.1 hypothetical protein CFV97608_1288 [Campylobacter fetus subsp. venerealis 97/608]QEL45166.1 hypothetical protein CFVT_1224 [Campylobacter fetus subsp. venerealis NCTC 10354]CDF64675.1 Plasmid partitioning protein ParA [Campylobacter fetus subsp. venerealis str. 84-112]
MKQNKKLKLFNSPLKQFIWAFLAIHLIGIGLNILIKMAKEQNEKLVAYIVINRASTNPFLYKKIESLRNFIEELEQDYIKLSQTIIYERERYKVATQLGLGVVEMKDGNKAEQEIRDLCNEICT